MLGSTGMSISQIATGLHHGDDLLFCMPFSSYAPPPFGQLRSYVAQELKHPYAWLEHRIPSFTTSLGYDIRR